MGNFWIIYILYLFFAFKTKKNIFDYVKHGQSLKLQL